MRWCWSSDVSPGILSSPLSTCSQLLVPSGYRWLVIVLWAVHNRTPDIVLPLLLKPQGGRKGSAGPTGLKEQGFPKLAMIWWRGKESTPLPASSWKLARPESDCEWANVCTTWIWLGTTLCVPFLVSKTSQTPQAWQLPPGHHASGLYFYSVI
jgi:hypothetical protein